MSNKTDKNHPIAPTLQKLAVGARATFHMHRLNTVKSTCSTLSVTRGLSFSTHLDRDSRTIEVTRTK